MNFFKKVIELKNRNFEFEAKLENHPLSNQNIYRLYYINYHRINEFPGCRDNNIGVIDWPFKPFMLPNGMSREDAFKVLSYLTDFIERELKLEPGSQKSVAVLDHVLDLERLGFRRVNISLDKDCEDIIELFTVTGRLQLFKNSSQYRKYVEWYQENVTFSEVKKIYKKCGIEFYDLVNKKEKTKVLVKKI